MSEGALPIGNILNSLMEHPEMLQKAMNLAGTLASSGVLDSLMNAPSEGGQTAQSEPTLGRYAPPQNSAPDLSGIGNLLSGLIGSAGNSGDKKTSESHVDSEQRDADKLSDRSQNFDRFNKNDSFSGGFSSEKQAQHLQDRSSHRHNSHVGHAERIRLLQSLRPFLPDDKQEKIDFVVKLLGLLEAAERMGLGKLF